MIIVEPWMRIGSSWRDQLAVRLPGVGYQVPEATFLAWLDCRRPRARR